MLEVYTNDQVSTEWFSELLLSTKRSIASNGEAEDPWWSQPAGQSERGILLSVEDRGKNGAKGPHPTEVLLYAATDVEELKPSAQPTLSSIGIGDNGSPATPSIIIPTLRLYAILLSSKILEYSHNFSELASPPLVGEGHAYFLPDYVYGQQTNAKRRDVSTLFEDATKQRRKLKSKGGESVAHAMASIDKTLPQQSARQPSQHVEDSRTQKALENGKQRGKLSRSASMGTPPNANNHDTMSRIAFSTAPKRSSLSRVESAYTHCESSIISDPEDNIIGQNRASLSKVVMAAMRLHGLQQKKKPADELTKRGSLGRSSTMTEAEIDQDKEDEYKLIYHQTLKAAMFAFRNHANSKLVSQEAMRDMVDRLLEIFCSDPLSSKGSMLLTTSGLQLDADNPFDLPSSSQQAASNRPEWSTPATKKRKTCSFANVDAG